MNDLLIYFAFPIATIILSIVLQKVLRNAILTSATFFAAYLIVTFTAFDINFLVYAIAYTILAYITAILTEFVIRRFFDENEQNNDEENCDCCMQNNNRTNEKINEFIGNENIRYRCFRR